MRQRCWLTQSLLSPLYAFALSHGEQFPQEDEDSSLSLSRLCNSTVYWYMHYSKWHWISKFYEVLSDLHNVTVTVDQYYIGLSELCKMYEFELRMLCREHAGVRPLTMNDTIQGLPSVWGCMDNRDSMGNVLYNACCHVSVPSLFMHWLCYVRRGVVSRGRAW